MHMIPGQLSELWFLIKIGRRNFEVIVALAQRKCPYSLRT